MSVGRDPVDRVVDLVVSAPLCTLIAARDGVPVLARAGGRQAMRLLGRAARLQEVAAPSVPRAAAVETPAAADDDRPELPIDGYDHLAARQVCDRLEALTASELGAVERYDRSHRGRRTVLGKIEQLTR